MNSLVNGKADHSVLCELDRVEKRFKRNASPVLGPLSLTLHAGEITGVRGDNGAGKSTLLNLIAGVCRPDGGEIRFADGVVRAIGFVPQELSLYESLSGNENLAFYGIAAGLPARAIRVRSKWLLNALSLSDKGKERVRAYSGGMKRRLHLASALMVTPRLLLLDEPTVGADFNSAEAILHLIAHLKSLGCGIVLTSHREGDLEKTCDRIVTLEKGRLV
ncbi:MAG: ABC transporter ATP-binding protein [Butyrivibrio sp.]|nr:ABC transporter ATP-binding protein [Butyrivibrio sp.]